MANTSTAVILARVSSKAQEDEGYSLDSQLKLLQNYCDRKGLGVVKTFKIAETASKQQSRRIFQELLAFISEQNIYHLTVEKTDRLTRNMRDAVAIDDWLEADNQRMLHAVKENLQLHKEAKSDVKFMWNIHLAVAKKYADNLREEAMKGWAEKLAQGWSPGVPPPGYKTVVQDGKRIHVIDQQKAPLIQRLFQRYLEPNQTIATICDEMKAKGLLTSRGRIYTKSGVHLLLKNPFYIGTIRFWDREYPGSQEPLIDKQLFAAVQHKMSQGRPPRYHTHNPLLKNMINCANCGGTITWQKQKGRYYGMCQRKTGNCVGKRLLREDRVEEIIINKLGELVCPSATIMDWVVGELESDYHTAIDDRAEVEQSLRTKLNRLEKMDEILYDDKLADEISLERYQQKHKEITAKIDEIKLQQSNLSTEISQRHQKFVSILKLAQRAPEIYKQKEDNSDKRTVLIKLFESMSANGDSVSVNYSKLTKVIAAKSEESRCIMQTLKLANKTCKNDVNNSGDAELDAALRPVWLGRRDSNPRMPVPKTGALPLGHAPISVDFTSVRGRAQLVIC